MKAPSTMRMISPLKIAAGAIAADSNFRSDPPKAPPFIPPGFSIRGPAARRRADYPTWAAGMLLRRGDTDSAYRSFGRFFCDPRILWRISINKAYLLLPQIRVGQFRRFRLFKKPIQFRALGCPLHSQFAFSHIVLRFLIQYIDNNTPTYLRQVRGRLRAKSKT